MKCFAIPLLLVSLFGCDENPALLHQIQADAAQRVAQFNTLRRAHMPVPKFELSNTDDYGEMDGLAVPIFINPALCEKDLDDCLNDTVPHELAHWALAYYGYYQPSLLITHSHQKTTMQIRESELPHDGIWCDTMRAFGGVPEKHGYCHK
jgi:hypothetical protein